INLAHETKTPLTLIQNYIEEYSQKSRGSGELGIVRNSISKITNDINKLLDNERIERGLAIYDHDQIVCFSDVLRDEVTLFSKYAEKRGIRIVSNLTKE